MYNSFKDKFPLGEICSSRRQLKDKDAIQLDMHRIILLPSIKIQGGAERGRF